MILPSVAPVARAGRLMDSGSMWNRTNVLSVTLVLGLAAGCAVADRVEPRTPVEPTILDGVYTEAQAMRGGQTFVDRCQSCHMISEFTGEAFMEEWEGLTVRELFDFVRYAMPALSHEGYGSDEYAEVLAFVLAMNGLPPGPVDLSTDRDVLALIRIETAN